MRLGSHHTPETKSKIASKKLGKPLSEEHKALLSVVLTGKKRSPETKERIAASKRGKKRKPFSEEHKANMRAALPRGENHWMFGKHLSPEQRAKLSESRKGKPISEEHKKILSTANSGENNPMFGRPMPAELKAKLIETHMGKPLSHETREKIRVAVSGENSYLFNRSKELHPWFGRKHTEDTLKKMRDVKLGKNNPNWRGGISYEPYCPKFNEDLKRRIRAFFDNRCIACGKSARETVRNLSCHHVEYNKAACCDGKPVQFAALCGKCHSRTNQDRDRWESMIHRIIEEVYNGRSYFTKEEWKEVVECQITEK